MMFMKCMSDLFMVSYKGPVVAIIRSDRISIHRKNVRMCVCMYVSKASNMTPEQPRSTQINIDQTM